MSEQWAAPSSSAWRPIPFGRKKMLLIGIAIFTVVHRGMRLGTRIRRFRDIPVHRRFRPRRNRSDRRGAGLRIHAGQEQSHRLRACPIWVSRLASCCPRCSPLLFFPPLGGRRYCAALSSVSCWSLSRSCGCPNRCRPWSKQGKKESIRKILKKVDPTFISRADDEYVLN